MPSGSYRQVYVKCPFYLYDDGAGRTCCELYRAVMAKYDDDEEGDQ